MLRVRSVVPGVRGIAILGRLSGYDCRPLRTSPNLSLRYSHGPDGRWTSWRAPCWQRSFRSSAEVPVAGLPRRLASHITSKDFADPLPFWLGCHHASLCPSQLAPCSVSFLESDPFASGLAHRPGDLRFGDQCVMPLATGQRLRASWQEDGADTELLRTAFRRYRAFFDQLTKV